MQGILVGIRLSFYGSVLDMANDDNELNDAGFNSSFITITTVFSNCCSVSLLQLLNILSFIV